MPSPESPASPQLADLSLSAILPAIDGLVFLLSLDGTIHDFRSGEASELLVPPAQFLGRRLAELFPPEQAAAFERAIARAARGESARVVYSLALPEDERWFEAHYLKLADAHVLAIIWDVSDRVRVERALEASTSRLRAVLDATPEGVAVLSPEGHVLELNAAGLALLEAPDLEAVRRLPLGDRFEPAHRAPFQAMLCDVAAGRGASRTLELSGDGWTRRFVEVIAVPLPGASGTGAGILALLRDVSDRYRTEAALRESEGRLAAAVRAFGIGIFDHDHATDRVYWSQELRAMHFWGADEPVTVPRIIASVHPADRDAFGSAVSRAHDPAGDGTFDIRYRVAAPGGEIRWLWSRSQTSFGDEDGRRLPLRTVGAVIDVTAQRSVEEALRIKDAAIDASINGIAIGALDGTLVYVNPAFVRLWRLTSAEDAVGRSALEFWQDPAQAGEVLRRLGAEGAWRGELLGRRADGSTMTIALAAALVRDPSGTPVRVMASFVDITEQRELTARLQHAQRLDSIGRLAGGVAHDFNNILTAILGYTQLLEDQVQRGRATNLDDLREVRLAAERAKGLTSQLLAFARRQVVVPRAVDVNAIVRRSERMLRRLLGEDIGIHSELAPSLALIHADPSQVEQVIVNLTVNARDAMPRGGRLTVETANVTLSGHRADDGQEVAAGPYVLLRVRDTGIGIAPDAMAHLFEPFYTTKPSGEGTGLGLATVYGIVRQAGGVVEVESAEGAGATFNVYFPRLTGDAAAPAPAEGEHPVPASSERVLVVEDDSAVRALTMRALREAGFRVQSTGTPTEALALVADATVPFDLVVTDVVMPAMAGPEMVARLHARQPGLRVLYVSGYPQDRAGELAEESPLTDFLAKPFSPRQLVARARELLDR